LEQKPNHERKEGEERRRRTYGVKEKACMDTYKERMGILDSLSSSRDARTATHISTSDKEQGFIVLVTICAPYTCDSLESYVTYKYSEIEIRLLHFYFSLVRKVEILSSRQCLLYTVLGLG
jgi:hypothetical protein